MICTKCFADDDIDIGAAESESLEVVVALCRDWLCPKCLDAEDEGNALTVSAGEGE